MVCSAFSFVAFSLAVRGDFSLRLSARFAFQHENPASGVVDHKPLLITFSLIHIARIFLE